MVRSSHTFILGMNVVVILGSQGFPGIFLLLGGMIVQHTTLMTIKNKKWCTSLELV